MESMSRSRLPSKKSSSSNTYAGKTIYDDVFGGPPQFGVPTLSPRSEDYTEIFQSFHSSRASSIPVLDLPVVDTNDLPFDVRSSKFDYTEIFGGFNTLDFAVSYEELFSHSNAGDDSSDDDWTPAQSDSLSDGSEKNHCLSNADAHSHQSLDFSEQFSGFYDKVNPEENEDNLNHAIHINFSQVANDVTRVAADGKRLRKSVTLPSNSNLSMHTHKSDSTGQGKEAFVSVSNINLRTQPSQVPPPSRPPPPLTVTKGDYDGLGLKLKASKSYAFERMTGESSPPYFDVEIDGSSSAAASAAAMKDAVEKAEAKLRSAKELMERKKEVQSRMKLRLDSDLKHEKEESVMKKINVLSSPIEGDKLIKKSRERNHGEHKLSHGSCDREGTAAWSEGSDFYEVVEKEQIKEEKIFEIAKSGESGLQIKGVAETFVGHQEHGKKILASRGEVQHKTNVKTVNEAGEFQLKKSQVDAKQKLKEANGNIKRNNSDWESKGTFKDEDYRGELQEAEESVEKLETKVNQQKEARETEECEKKEKEAREREEKEVCERREKEKKEKVACERREKEQWERREKEAREREANEKKQKEASEREEKKTKQKEAHERDENEKKQKDAFVLETIKKPKLPSDVEQKEKNLTESVEKKEDESKQIKDFEGGLNERGPSGDYEGDDSMVRIDGVCGEKDDKNSTKESQMQKDNEKRSQEACEIGERDTREEVLIKDRRIESQECTGKEESDWQVNPSQGRVTNEGKKWKESDKYERDGEKMETSPNALSCEEDRRSEKEVELVEGLNVRVEEKINSSGKVEFLHVNNSKKECNGIGQSYVDLENPNILAHKREEREKNIKGFNFSFYQKGSKDRLVKNVNEALAQEEREKEERSKREMERLRKIEEERERENERLRKIEEERERERENERLRKIEEEREREREREKDRMEVNRATLERANGEAKERVEREAVERATAEFRQRALAEAREKLEKATAEARLRAEQRAAVEKATTEARERAAEKVLRHSYSSSDLPGPQVGSSSGSRILHTSVSFGVESESAQRCKARLERHQRTAERAANALAEKNQRDLLAQREQAERSRLAENLDAEVKRWSSGKEGNLRALLSTLQYILGPDSGWQPLPLTEVITAVAVKKAYRKATLCVHPDKLQQRGATIHQKYICEKVFDLLKEAWNKFNSEER